MNTESIDSKKKKMTIDDLLGISPRVYPEFQMKILKFPIRLEIRIKKRKDSWI